MSIRDIRIPACNIANIPLIFTADKLGKYREIERKLKSLITLFPKTTITKNFIFQLFLAIVIYINEINNNNSTDKTLHLSH